MKPPASRVEAQARAGADVKSGPESPPDSGWRALDSLELTIKPGNRRNLVNDLAEHARLVHLGGDPDAVEPVNREASKSPAEASTATLQSFSGGLIDARRNARAVVRRLQ